MNKKDVGRKRMTLRINNKIYESVEKEASKLGISVNGYISMVLSKESEKTG